MKILYKKDSKNKIRVWKIYTSGSSLIQESGLENGKLVKHEKECTPKNVNRSNETTGAKQAKLELESLVKDKISEGYFETKEEAETEEVILPMLAKSYNDYSKKIDWETTYIQSKLDGMRNLCIIKNNRLTFMSRDGKVIEGLHHIKTELATYLKEDTDVVLDGELYAHGLSFQDNMRLIKKYRPGKTESIKYHVYDLISGASFIDRYTELSELVKGLNTVELVDTREIKNEKELKKHHARNISEGFEGSIIRWGTKGYKVNGRSENLLKYKDFQDIDLEIIDVIPSEAKPEQGVLVCKLPNGLQCKASLKLSHEDRAEVLKNKKDYIGKQRAEVRYFEKTDEGNLRFPVCVGFRLDK